MYQNFEQTNYLHLQGRRTCQKENNVEIEGIGDGDNASGVTLQTFFG
jgi:hypothetical protein